MFSLLSAFFAGLLLLLVPNLSILGRTPDIFVKQALYKLFSAEKVEFSRNVSQCPGKQLLGDESQSGLLYIQDMWFILCRRRKLAFSRV